MIQLQCSNCKAQLAIDDAFAGGVCRCQHCGTIQTVPKPGRENVDGAAIDSPKALFKRKARIESALSPYNDGLDRAADEMDSSGSLSASSIASAPNRRSSSPVGDDVGGSSQAGSAAGQFSSGAATATATRTFVPKPSAAASPSTPLPAPAAGKGKMARLIGAAVGVALVAGTAIYAFTGGETAPSVSDSSIQSSGAEASICGMPLRGQTVVYILDRSGVTQQAFNDMSKACFTSAESLGSSRRFQIMVWNNHQDLAYPADQPLEASGSQIENARKAIVDTYAGSSDIAALLNRAAAAGATDVVILSAVDADEQLSTEISDILKQKSIRLHAVAVGSDLQGDQLRKAATDSGGQFRQLALESLH